MNKSPLAYVPSSVPKGGIMNISPSSFGKFVEKPHVWFTEQVMKETTFNYSTSTVLGTIVHYCAECVAKDVSVSVDCIDDYINSFEENEEYSKHDVRENYPAMAKVLVNQYVLPNKYCTLDTECFKQIQMPHNKKFYVGGTIDRLEGSVEDCTIVDYKTYNSKTKPKSISSHYKYQLLVYAWVLKLLGYDPTRMKLVYVNRNIDGGISEKTQKPLKSYPPEITELVEVITEEDLLFIEGLLYLAADSVDAWKKYPELAHVIWHDPRLKTV